MAPERSSDTPAPKPPLDGLFAGFGEPVGSFVRSLLTLAEFRGDLGHYAAEPNVRIVRASFGKWSLELLAELGQHRQRSFGELRTALPKVSARVLSQKLLMLEQAGLVHRTVRPTRPPRPSYTLTENASELMRRTGKILQAIRQLPLPTRARPVPVASGSEEQAHETPAKGTTD